MPDRFLGAETYTNGHFLSEESPVFEVAELPNGALLKYSYFDECGSQLNWSRSRSTSRLLAALKNQKEYLPRLGLWNSGSDQHVIVADFDVLPEGIASFEQLSCYLKTLYQREAIVCRSASKRCKMFFVVQMPDIFWEFSPEDPMQMTVDIALATLEEALGFDDYDLFSYIDQNRSSLSQTFLTKGIVESLEKLRLLPATDAVIPTNETDWEQNRNKTITTVHRYRRFKGELSEELVVKFAYDSKRERLLRILMASPQLLSEKGFQLPQTKLAKECEVSTSTINAMLKQLIDLGWLVCINIDFEPGKYAKAYRANRLLAQQIPRYKLTSSALPKEIKDGTWHTTLWECSKHYIHEPDEFFKQVFSTPGFECKDRLRHAVFAITRRRKYAGLENIDMAEYARRYFKRSKI